MLNHPDIPDTVPLLLFANKQDLKEVAKSPAEIQQMFLRNDSSSNSNNNNNNNNNNENNNNINIISNNYRNRDIRVEGMSALTGYVSIGLSVGLSSDIPFYCYQLFELIIDVHSSSSLGKEFQMESIGYANA